MESVKRYASLGNMAQRSSRHGGTWVSAEDFDRVIAERDEQVHSLEQRLHAEQQACQAAERRVKELESLVPAKYKEESGSVDAAIKEGFQTLNDAISLLNSPRISKAECDVQIALEKMRTLNLQNRLTVQDQREDDLKGLVRSLVEYADQLLRQVNEAWSYAGSTGAPETHKDADYLRALELLNPTAEAETHGESKPAVGSVVLVHDGIKAVVKSHHADGLIVGAGDGHLVTQWSKP